MRRPDLWRSRWAAVGAAVAVTLGLGGVAGLSISSAAPSAEVARASSSFIPIAPVRILDTRPSPTNVGGFVGPLGPNAEFTLQVTGAAGVPADASSVVMNVTVDGTTAPSFLTVYPSDQVRPNASNLNWVAGDVIPNLTTVALSADGKVNIYNFAGSTHVIADVAGYYVPAGTKTLDLDLYQANLRNGAVVNTGFGANAGIGLPDAASPAVDLSFVVPLDYTPGTPLTMTVLWFSPAPSCGFDFRPNFTSVARPGLAPLQGTSASSGLESVGGDVRTAPATANEVTTAVFTVTSPDAAVPLQPGDSYIFGVFRPSASPADTCGGVQLSSAVVSYS